MLKIGYIDYFLDEWHAEHYPAWIKQQGELLGIKAEVTFAWADINAPEGEANQAWCDRHGITLCGSEAEVIALSDAIIVLSPNHSQHHERLSKLALQSGKPVYIDKTFSPDAASGARMFDLAEKYGTPMFSASALRFSRQLMTMTDKDKVCMMSSTGPGDFETYAVHQVDMLVAVLGAEPRRMMAVEQGVHRQIIIEFEKGTGSLLQMPELDFNLYVGNTDGHTSSNSCSDFFENLIAAMLEFFVNPANLPVTRQETMACMRILETGKQALRNPGSWFAL